MIIMILSASKFLWKREWNIAVSGNRFSEHEWIKDLEKFIGKIIFHLTLSSTFTLINASWVWLMVKIWNVSE